MVWCVIYANKDIEKSILALPKKMLAKYLSLMEVVIQAGPGAKIPQIEQIYNNKYKLKVEEDENFTNIYYYVDEKNQIVVSHMSDESTSSKNKVLT